MKLAAANTAGYVLIWDIRAGVLLKDFVEPNKQPVCMEWLTGHDVSHDLLLVLYQPNLMILWNADTGIKLWKKVFTDPILQMTIDPFKNSNMTGLSLIYYNYFALNIVRIGYLFDYKLHHTVFY